jgi:hypothetical protein
MCLEFLRDNLSDQINSRKRTSSSLLYLFIFYDKPPKLKPDGENEIDEIEDPTATQLLW